MTDTWGTPGDLGLMADPGGRYRPPGGKAQRAYRGTKLTLFCPTIIEHADRDNVRHCMPCTAPTQRTPPLLMANPRALMLTDNPQFIITDLFDGWLLFSYGLMIANVRKHARTNQMQGSSRHCSLQGCPGSRPLTPPPPQI